MMATCSPCISDYAIIGNGQTTALIDRHGSIDWCCWPRCDSPALLCRILDRTKGGYFKIAPTDSNEVSRQYVTDTNVLQTTFKTKTGVLRVTDLMPAPFNGKNGEHRFPHRILRKVEVLAGEVDLQVDFFPTFNFALDTAEISFAEKGVTVASEAAAVGLVGPLPLDNYDGHLRARHAARTGEVLWFILTHEGIAARDELLAATPEDAERELEHTVSYWKRWIDTCRYKGQYESLVRRSALTLKLLFYQHTGAIIAAPTTSIPADPGGERNWDYRYTWLRDSALVLDVLSKLGFYAEYEQYIGWLETLKHESTIYTAYTVDGQPVPEERELNHLQGFASSQPVRIGNAAGTQLQNDKWGQIMDAIFLCYENEPRKIDPEFWQFLCSLMDSCIENWREPDHGPWEMRKEAEHYVYSTVYCWIALDRAICFAQIHNLEAPLERWREERDAIQAEVLQHGFNEELNYFTQSYETDVIDASALVLPIVNFIAPDDPRMEGTRQQVEEKLCEGGLVYRYRADDGLPGADATFGLCSFWRVSNLALLGKIDKARELFEDICSYANDLGLLAEQIDPESGRQTGNFPQGFTHLGLIRAALYIEKAQNESDEENPVISSFEARC